MADISTMVRRGVISNVDTNTHKAQAFFPDMDNMVSDWLPVVHHGTAWDPEVGDNVVVLMAHGFNSDGFILGVIP